MEIAKLVLEYFKVFLTAPMLFSVVAVVFICKFSDDIKALLLRIAKITLPGGAELSTLQSNRIAEEKQKSAPQAKDSPVQDLPSGLSPEHQQAIEQLVRSHIANAYLWEYRYLNYFLARSTQVVFDWLIGLSQPTTYAHYDSSWMPFIPSANERQAIITALQMHHLVLVHDVSNMITVTPKGMEYQEWRGELPPPTSMSTGRS